MVYLLCLFRIVWRIPSWGGVSLTNAGCRRQTGQQGTKPTRKKGHGCATRTANCCGYLEGALFCLLLFPSVLIIVILWCLDEVVLVIEHFFQVSSTSPAGNCFFSCSYIAVSICFTSIFCFVVCLFVCSLVFLSVLYHPSLFHRMCVCVPCLSYDTQPDDVDVMRIALGWVADRFDISPFLL